MAIIDTDRKLMRAAFRPSKVKLLLVCDAPPSNGRFFFDKSFMTKITQRAVENTFGVCFDSVPDFLNDFKQRGFYFDDLSHTPIDTLSPKRRNQKLWESVPTFSDRLCQMQPNLICTLAPTIEVQVQHAVQSAGLNTDTIALPYPGNGQQFKYMEVLSMLLRQVSRQGGGGNEQHRKSFPATLTVGSSASEVSRNLQEQARPCR